MGKAKARQMRVRCQEIAELMSGTEENDEKMHKYCEQLMAHSRGPRCLGCWLMEENCMCEASLCVDNATKVVVHIHHGEWARSSNTGISIHRTLKNSELCLKGHKEHQARLQEIYNDPDMVKCVLWPGETALTVSEFKKSVEESGGKGVVVLVPDGSFRGARKMASKYPQEFPRVKLSPMSVLEGKKVCLMGPVRKYGGSEEETGRVSTLEAVAAFLTEMGESEKVAEALKHNMRLKMDMVLKQKHRPMVYGTVQGSKT
ncbi:hypothetical protein BSKO_12453 [Bryopsis sp. KO-2023]|nr:hypothetical protein BSKO_12453 [Bryopsis sp. KO-2023]